MPIEFASRIHFNGMWPAIKKSIPILRWTPFFFSWPLDFIQFPSFLLHSFATFCSLSKDCPCPQNHYQSSEALPLVPRRSSENTLYSFEKGWDLSHTICDLQESSRCNILFKWCMLRSSRHPIYVQRDDFVLPKFDLQHWYWQNQSSMTSMMVLFIEATSMMVLFIEAKLRLGPWCDQLAAVVALPW